MNGAHLAAAAPWRPLGQLDLDGAHALLSRSLAAWQEKWLPVAALQVAAGAPIAAGGSFTAAADARLWSCGAATTETMWVALQPSASDTLMQQVLDLPASFMAAAALSRPALLASLEQSLLDDLLASLAGAMALTAAQAGAPQQPPPADAARLAQGGARFDICSGSGQLLLSIVCTAPLLRKNIRVPPAAAASVPALKRRMEALADMKIDMRACLGQVHITVPQLRTLAAGDVLMLEQSLEKAVPIVLSATAERVAEGMLGRSGERFSMQLTTLA